MQRNEVDALLSTSEVGLGTPELWQKLSIELDGRTILEKPHVSKKTLLKAIRMQTDAMRYMVDEFDRIREKMNDIERETKNSQKQMEKFNTKINLLQENLDETNQQIDQMENILKKHDEKLNKMDDLEFKIQENQQEIVKIHEFNEQNQKNIHLFVEKISQELENLEKNQTKTQLFTEKLQERMDTEEKELFLQSDHIIHDKLSLSMWIEINEKENNKKEDAIKECTEKMMKQGTNVEEMMLETRRTLDENTSAVEDVQRLLLEKADRKKVDEIIESKYEEICNQLDKALASVIGEEDEFKRVIQELQQLVTHLSEAKADKKDLLEVKEQILYDSRVRQQVENLRSFIDLKINREDVFSALKNKADREEMNVLLKSLSDSMNASILQAQKSINEPENAFLTINSINSKKILLPSIERDKCLSCNSSIRDRHHQHSGGLVNRNAAPLTPMFGGGFAMNMNMNGHVALSPSRSTNSFNFKESKEREKNLLENASEGLLLGLDGHVYQGDPDAMVTLASSSSSGAIPERLQANEKASRASPVFKAPNAVIAQRRNMTLEGDEPPPDGLSRGI